ncbi:MAG: DNA polymerase III subunit delta [Bacteroides sp.]|nr:DNA polymerase III subunit delta [Ruminococcus flavefaciens]MCM1553910.1 DNA polymerase III subunit delta [Bacteroides sp.]
MPTLKYADLVKQLRSQKPAPVYLLWGEEDFYIDRIEKIFETELLDDMQKEFDYSVYFGQDLKAKEPGLRGVIANCKRFPVMAPFQLILVKEAQAIDRWEAVEEYLQKPVESTVLVFCHKHKKIDKRKSVFKLFDKAGVCFESAPLKDKDYMPWIEGYLKENGYGVQPQALALLSESLGGSLNMIANELNKLFVNLPQGTAITEDHVEQFVGINKEYNPFALEKALAMRDLVGCRKICNHIKQNPKDFPLPPLMAIIYRLYARIIQVHSLKGRGTPRNEWAATLGVNPYFMGQYETAASRYSYRETAAILQIVKTYDLKSKGYGGNLSHEAFIDELCFRLLHAC